MDKTAPKRPRGRPKKEQSQDLRSTILDCAIRLFSENGFEAVMIKDIATASGVATSLVHHHFGSREGLRAACRDHVIARIRDTLDSFTANFPEGSSLDLLDLYGMTLREGLGTRTHLLRFLAMTLMDGHEDSKTLFRDYFNLFHQITLRFHSQGNLRDDIDPVWITMQAVYMQLGTSFLFDPLEDFLGKDPYDPDVSRLRTEAFVAIAKSGISKQ